MKISRRFTQAGQDVFSTVQYEKRTSRISNPDGSVVFEMKDAEIPAQWSQLATDIMVSKYFRKAGVPQYETDGTVKRDEAGNLILGPEKSAKQVIHRLAGCWRMWGETHGYFDTPEDAQAFYDELSHMLLNQMCAPNSPQWFNTGLNFAYNITGPAQGHFYCDPRTGELTRGADAYTHPQPHACQPFHAPISTPQGPVVIGDIVTKNLIGLEVFDGTAEGKGTTRVRAVKSNGDKPVFRIVLKNGLHVEATADHVVWALDERRGAGQWLRVDQLNVGQRMQVSTVTDVTKQSDEAETLEAALVGWAQGDGFVGQYAEGTNRSLTIELMTVNDDEHAYVMRHVNQVFEGVHCHVRTIEAQDPNLTIRRIRLYGEKLRPFVEKYELFGGCADRSVPAAIRRAGQQAQAAYLRGLFQADGTVRLRSRLSRTSDVVLTTVSAELAQGVQALLLNQGIYARIQRGVEKRENRRTPYFVSIGYASARVRFADRIGFVSADKIAKLASATSGEFPGKELPNLRDELIVRIEQIGVQPVYDIQTESGQYLCGNVIVHNCFIQSVEDDLVNPGGIMDLWTREARLFKYGSGTGSNFSKVRGENEKLSGGGKSSGLMSFLKIGDRAAGAIKSGGTTRRAAKMVCLDLDHPDVEDFVNWKVREELKVAALAEGMKHLSDEQKATAKKLGLKLDYDFNGEAYMTVSGQNSNNSVRIPNSFFKALETDGEWKLFKRLGGGDKVHKTLKARDLWDQISYAAWRCADPGVQYDSTINEWHTCPNSGRINASNPCVTGDTRVLTPGGIWRRIDQMIHLPARVITNLDGQEIHVTEGAFPTGTREVYELRTAGGYKLKLTADHKVYTRSRGWVAARDLTPADEVKLPSKPAAVHEVGEPQDSRFFQMLGFFLSGTNADTTRLHLDACVDDASVRDDFTRYVAETWGETAPARGYPDDYVIPGMLGNDESTDEQGDDVGGTATAVFTNRRLMSRLRAFVRNDATTMVAATMDAATVAESTTARLSDEAFTAGLAAQKHLLRALFTADGVIDHGVLELPSTSREFLEDVQLILLGFGVQSGIRSRSGQSAVGSAQNGAADSLLSAHRPLPTAHSSDIGALPASPETSIDGTAVSRHGLRIDAGSLRNFARFIGLLPGRKLRLLADAVSFAISRPDTSGHWERVGTVSPLGPQQVFDLTEPVTSSFVANGITVHNCSEYMFLDDTACNLASLNVLTFFDPTSKQFDIERFKHGVRIWTIVLEISVLMASFPSEKIAELSYKFRTLGLGYANLGAMLMQAGIAYDSEKGRAICGALTAILTGESYATSAEMAKEHGPFPGYAENREHMLRVIRNHRRAAYGVGRDQGTKGPRDQGNGNTVSPSSSSPQSLSPSVPQSLGNYESLDIHPVPIDATQFPANDPLAAPALLASARETWDRALSLGQQFGYRNAQTTVIAPTGTIGLLMDCDTTGVEPDFALVKFKKLAGGGYFKIANQSLQPALKNLGYEPAQIHEILQYVMGTLTLDTAPVINTDALLSKGFTVAELNKIDNALPGTFELSFAFSPWSLGADVMKRLGVSEAEWQDPRFNLLRKLGFTKRQIDSANDVICGRGTVEGAPHLRDEHLSVFDCANKCGKTGKRFIAVEGHIRMMAAAQPFISGAISKTINLPNEATLDDIKNAYQLSWELGLKANALYRDGSKLSQPLNIKSDAEIDDEESEENVAAAKAEVAKDVAKAAALAASSEISNLKSEISNLQSSISDKLASDNLSPAPEHTRVIEKIVERIVERPLRRRLPDTRNAITHKFDVAGHEGYITVGLYEDGSPGEVFITMAKEGSTIGGLMDTIATLVSVSLQYGVGVESLVRKFEHVRFEPSGMTRNQEIPFAKSLVDYIFRWLAMEFVPGYRATNAPRREPPAAKAAPAVATPAPAASTAPSAETSSKELASSPKALTSSPKALASPLKESSADESSAASHLKKVATGAGQSEPLTASPLQSLPNKDQGEAVKPKKSGNGHHPRMEIDTARPFAYGDEKPTPAAVPDTGVNLRLAVVADPLSAQGSNMQADAPACDVCGSITVRSGTCYKCLNCGNSMGCS